MLFVKRFACLIYLLFLTTSSFKKSSQNVFVPRKGAHIVILGNTFAERLQYYNYFEPLLYSSFPGLDLTVRNMGWSADEVNLQPRPLHFGTLDEHLSEQKADIIVACFGLNESFKGLDSLENYKLQLSGFLRHLMAQSYNGIGHPNLVLVSPIATEKFTDVLPDPAKQNKNLALYTEGMKAVSASLNIPFIDLYHYTSALMSNGSDSLTINGIHLNDKGYKLVGEEMARSLNFKISSWQSTPAMTALKKVVDEKNKHFFYKFRAVNGEYIYGRRKEPWVQPPGSILSYPTEMKAVEQITRSLDSLLWASSAEDRGPDLAKMQKTISYSQQSEPRVPIAASTDQFIIKEGYEIQLFASEVDFPVEKPVKITFDPKGRMWVASMPSYPQYYPGCPPNDKIIILEDTNHDGRADKSIVFADSLYMPLGFELGEKGVYVSQPPNLVFMKDTNGDDHVDTKEIILQGFGTEDVHHSINAHAWGQDGALYMHMGTFLHSQVETPYGPVRGAYGETYRFEPRTQKLEAYVSYPYANPWGNVFMRNGTHLIGDVSTGMNYFAPPLTVAIDYPKKHVQMKDFLTAKLKPKTCGMEIISSRQFPDDVQGDVLFNLFVGFQGIRQHSIAENGSGIIGTEKDPLLQSKDPNFRPVDLQFGPDGALYVVDWFNAIINHGERALRDPARDHSHGRIWRIVYKNKKPLVPVDLSRLRIPELLDQLKTYEDRVRYRTRIQLNEYAADQVLPAAYKWIEALDKTDALYEQHKLEGLWLYQQFNQTNEKLLNDLLAAKDPNVRAAATRVLFYWRDRIKNSVQQLASMARDPSPRVRVEGIVALSHDNTEAAVNALLAATEMPVDYYISYALKESFKQLKPVWMEMFKKNKNFLADDPDKANFLLMPLYTADSLVLPGFFGGDPDASIYLRDSLSKEDFKMLAAAPAVKKFLSTQEARAVSAKTVKTADLFKLVVKIAALPGKMAFDKKLITAVAGSTITLSFENADQMPHNIVIIKPGTSDKVGKASAAMAALKDGYERSFVPVMPEVLFSTPLVTPGKKLELSFKVPVKIGDYPFHCSFPGHWQVMKGLLRVVKGGTAGK